MTRYKLTPSIPQALVAQQKKAARNKLLEEVKARRKIISQQFEKRRQLQADGDLL